MTNDDRLLGYRLQLFAWAERTRSPTPADVRHPSEHLLRLEAPGRAHGLEILRPRERRRPKMPNALPAMVEDRVLSFAIATPASGRGGWPRSLPGGSGAGSWSPTPRSGASCAATGSRRARVAARSWPATALPTSPPESPSQSATSRPIAPASSSAAWTAFCGTPQRHQGSGLAAHRHGCRLLVWCRPNIRRK